jgi:putative membrane protein
MMRPGHMRTAVGLMCLALLWGGPLPGLARHLYAGHMGLHMGVVALAIPLLASGLVRAGVGRWPLPVLGVATLLDMVVVWLWHLPGLQGLARSQGWALAAEQASFAGAALLVWVAAHAAPPHMTLLGVLISLAPRLLHDAHSGAGWPGLAPLADQQLGGLLMLAAAGTVYLGAALALAARGLDRAEARPAA